jgi:hypothetical protein
MDTVIITIYGPRKFQITNTSWFLPELTRREYFQLSPTEKQSKQSMRPYLRHFVFHPPYQDGYLPKIEIFETLTKNCDALRYVLKATFSIPKLLYRNSLQEVSELVGLETVISALKKALGGVGIVIESDTIANARVSAVHFCKNTLLPQNIRMQEILAELQRVDISKVIDITEKEVKNGGRVLHIYSGTIERVFYDKIADAMRPKVKRKDKGRINHERTIIERFELQNREVFRYEYRVKKAQTVMREINAALGREYKTFVAFKDLFTPNLCKTMILKSWHKLIQRPENQLALFGPIDNLTLLLHILAQAKKLGGDGHSMNRALISYGLARAIRDHGAKETRRAIFTGWNTDHTERLTRKIEAAAKLIQDLPYSNAIAFIDKAFEQFELITLPLLENGL